MLILFVFAIANLRCDAVKIDLGTVTAVVNENGKIELALKQLADIFGFGGDRQYKLTFGPKDITVDAEQGVLIANKRIALDNDVMDRLFSIENAVSLGDTRKSHLILPIGLIPANLGDSSQSSSRDIQLHLRELNKQTVPSMNGNTNQHGIAQGRWDDEYDEGLEMENTTETRTEWKDEDADLSFE